MTSRDVTQEILMDYTYQWGWDWGVSPNPPYPTLMKNYELSELRYAFEKSFQICG